MELVEFSKAGDFNCFTVNPNGQILAAGFLNTIRLCEMESGKELKTLFGHSDIVTSTSYIRSCFLIFFGLLFHVLKLPAGIVLSKVFLNKLIVV